MAGQQFLQLLGLRAGFAGIGTAGREAAAGLGIDGADQLTFQLDALSGGIDIRGRNGGDQRLCVGMQGLPEQLLTGAGFHQLT